MKYIIALIGMIICVGILSSGYLKSKCAEKYKGYSIIEISKLDYECYNFMK